MKLAVGFFDGVHRGHQAILSGADAALTFSNHPLSVLCPERAPVLVMDTEEKVAAIRACGVKDVFVLDFTRELAGEEPEAFVDSVCSLCGVTRSALSVRCGANWRFGKGGAGDAAYLRTLGIPVEVLPYAEHLGEAISSTRVRRALEAGDLESVRAMLGRPYAVSGKVVVGKGIGRALGFPTVNVQPACRPESVRLPLGVYVVEAKGVRAVANFGLAPTMGDRAWRQPTWELHFLQDVPDMPSEGCLRFEALRHLRPERTFASLEELQRQIALDRAEALR